MKRITKVKIYTKNDYNSLKVRTDLEKQLIDNNIEIVDKDYELAISIGGDGTFLNMVREENFNNQIYYVGVNSGTLGFLQEIDIQNTKDFVKKLIDGDYKEEEISIQKTDVYTTNGISSYYSLNEIVLRREDLNILDAPIYIDNVLLENFHGDGILVSTSTGSTAYNMSFSGGIIYNSIDALILTPIAPLNNKAYKTLNVSIVIPNDKEIEVTLDNVQIFLIIDGRKNIIKDTKSIRTKIDERKIKCLRMNNYHFINVVNKKIIGN